MGKVRGKFSVWKLHCHFVASRIVTNEQVCGKKYLSGSTRSSSCLNEITTGSSSLFIQLSSAYITQAFHNFDCTFPYIFSGAMRVVLTERIRADTPLCCFAVAWRTVCNEWASCAALNISHSSTHGSIMVHSIICDEGW